ncbi:MAG: hypothetical protein ACFCVG_04770 [Kineosporiaceae bacterium]
MRCVFGTPFPDTYEERVTIWNVANLDTAIALAEEEAEGYAADIGGEYLGLAQAYSLTDSPEHGAEVFSLMRESTLAADDYLDAFFDTGDERQRSVDS